MITASTSPWPFWLRKLRARLKREPTEVDPADVKAALQGYKRIRAYGHVVTVKPEKGPAPSDLRIRHLIVAGRAFGLRDETADVFRRCIVDWDELNFYDLWRDPEVAMKIFQVIRRG